MNYTSDLEGRTRYQRPVQAGRVSGRSGKLCDPSGPRYLDENVTHIQLRVHLEPVVGKIQLRIKSTIARDDLYVQRKGGAKRIIRLTHS